MARALSLVLSALLGSACAGEPDRSTLLVEDETAAPVQLIGVSPLDFRCDLVVNLQSVAGALGRPVEMEASGFTPPAGVPKPCQYVSTAADRPGLWSFDLDCRERALDTGAQLMAEFAVDPGARPVLVGRSGIDHHGVQLLFVDDDAPCYVRVMGPGEAERLALARLVADGLVRSNAPGRVVFR